MTGSRHISRFSVAALGATLVTAFGAHPLEGADRWLLVETEHFSIYSNAGEKRGREIGEQFETIYQVYAAAFPTLKTPPEKAHVLAAKNEKTMKQIIPWYWEEKDRSRPAGIFRRSMGREDIAVRVDFERDARYRVVYHEYFHQLVHLNLPTLPVWLDEGLADFWGTVEYEKGRVRIGIPNEGRLGEFGRQSMLPMETLLKVHRGSPEYGKRGKVGVFYSQAWALTHFLMMSQNGDRRPELADYMDRLQAGETSLAAGRAAFGDLKKLRTDLEHYVRQTRFFQFYMVPPDKLDTSTFHVSELSEPEAMALKADFVVRGGVPDKARSLANAALKKSPEQVKAFEALGLLAMRERKLEEAKDWFSKAVERPDASHVAHYYHATLMDNNAPSSPELIETHFLRSLSKRKRFAAAYVGLGYHYARVDPNLARSLAMVKQAAAANPYDATLRSLVARVLEKMGNHEEAKIHIVDAVRSATAKGIPLECNNLCWFGSLAGFADTVRPLCDIAVIAVPESSSYRDSRGVARSILGDHAGAIDDLQFFVDDVENGKELRRAREEWILALERGENPFKNKVLVAELLNQPF